jgi:acetyl esterase/lipase
MRKTALAVLAVLCVANSVKAQDRPRPDAPYTVRAQMNVEYGKVGDESLRLDLYTPVELPKDPARLRPGLIMIHGGGWSGGDKAEYATFGKEMASRGYVAASVNYRFAPKHHYPANIDDVQRAVRWLRQHAKENSMDPERVGATGSSAGGHLASMLGVLDTRDPAVPASEGSSRVQCVADFYGRMDLTLEPTNTNFHDYRQDYIGKTKDQALSLYQEASPVSHVDKSTVPFLIVQGAVDPQVQPAQSERMFRELQKVGIESSLIMLGGQGHGFNGAAAQNAWDFAKAFLDRHLVK